MKSEVSKESWRQTSPCSQPAVQSKVSSIVAEGPPLSIVAVSIVAVSIVAVSIVAVSIVAEGPPVRA